MMPIREAGGARPMLADDVFIAPNAEVIGDVTMREHSSVWFSSTVRASGAPVILGVGTDIQDNSLVDSETGYPAELGDHVSLGHGATVHGAVLEDYVLIAMNATVSRGCRIGSGSIVAANALVPEGKNVPPRSLVIGESGRIIRDTTDAEYERIVETASGYMKLAQEYRATLDGACE